MVMHTTLLQYKGCKGTETVIEEGDEGEKGERIKM